jgi:hypothetical protein
MFTTMMMTTTTATNDKLVGQASKAWDQLLRMALQRGFHGSVTVEVTVQDGTIQHVRRKVEQQER